MILLSSIFTNYYISRTQQLAIEKPSRTHNFDDIAVFLSGNGHDIDSLVKFSAESSFGSFHDGHFANAKCFDELVAEISDVLLYDIGC